jgi:hypothetical protein
MNKEMSIVEFGMWNRVVHSTLHIPHSTFERLMPRDTQRSGLSLVLAGLLGGAFFWLTDPRWGVAAMPSAQVIDAIQRASVGTWVGIGGCAVIAVIGVWLMLRRTA